MITLIITCITLIGMAYIKTISTWIYILVLFPSTFFHELSHWLVAFLLGARPSIPRLIPKRESDTTWALGSVTFVVNPLTAALIALAPLWLLGSSVAFMLLKGLESSTEWWMGVLLGNLLVGSLPSRADWVIALKNPTGLLLVFFCGLGVVELLFSGHIP